MPGQHSRIGASGAAAALACPGKLAAEAPYPNLGNRAASEGTAFHDTIERALLTGTAPDAYLFDLVEVNEAEDSGTLDEAVFILVDRAMVAHMTEGLRLLREEIERMGPDTLVYVETRVILEPWLGEGEFGTADIILVNVAARRIVVWDWKYGIGVPVYPTWNLQAILYCLGSWHTIVADLFDNDPLDITVDVVIHQPRIPHAGGRWTVDLMELLIYGRQLPALAEATLDPNAPRIPGEKQCQFCRARRKCGARSQLHLQNMLLEFEDLDAANVTGADIALTSPRDMTQEQKAQVALHAKDFMKWCREVQADIERDLRRGSDAALPVKMVEGNRASPRSWKKGSEKAVEKVLVKRVGDDAFTRKVLSPTQVGERFPAVYGDLEKHVQKGEKKPILVPKHDPRPALAGIAEEFEDLTEEEGEDDGD